MSRITAGYKGGIWNKELIDYQEKAEKYDKLVSLAKEENQCRSRIKAIAQERCKLIGIGEKYGVE